MDLTETLEVNIGVGTWEDYTYRPIVEVNGVFTVYEDEVCTEKEAARRFAMNKADEIMTEWENGHIVLGYAVSRLTINGEKLVGRVDKL